MEDDTSPWLDAVAVITGASRGIGAGLAAEFSRQGLRLGLCARHRPALPGGSTEERTLSVAVDVTDEAAMGRFTEEVLDRFGRIDLWVNNAGVLEPIGPQREIDAVAFRRHLEVNVTGTWIGSRCFLRAARARQRSLTGGLDPALINVSSGAGRHGYPGWAAYCAGKAAVDRLTEVIAIEERGFVRAHAVAPGVVDTAMQQLIRAQSAEDFPLVERFRAMQRDDAFSTPREVAHKLLDLVWTDPSAEVLIDLRQRGGVAG